MASGSSKKRKHVTTHVPVHVVELEVTTVQAGFPGDSPGGGEGKDAREAAAAAAAATTTAAAAAATLTANTQQTATHQTHEDYNNNNNNNEETQYTSPGSQQQQQQKNNKQQQTTSNSAKKARQRQDWQTISIHPNEAEAEAACRRTGACEWVVYDSKESVCKRFVCKLAGVAKHQNCQNTVRWKRYPESGAYHVQLAHPCAPKSSNAKGGTKSASAGNKNQAVVPTRSYATVASGGADSKPVESATPLQMGGVVIAPTASGVIAPGGGGGGGAMQARAVAHQAAMDNLGNMLHVVGGGMGPPSLNLNLANSEEEVRNLRDKLRAKDDIITQLTAELAAAQNEMVHLREFTMMHWPQHHGNHHGMHHGMHQQPYGNHHSHHGMHWPQHHGNHHGYNGMHWPQHHGNHHDMQPSYGSHDHHHHHHQSHGGTQQERIDLLAGMQASLLGFPSNDAGPPAARAECE
ncbi:hypothetical protein NFJ02_40g105540 [Pycnococcus provasolii]